MNTRPPESTQAATTDEQVGSMPWLFDAHLDLAMNALEWNRDLTRPLAELRASEAGMTDRPDRGRGTVCFPELRRAGVRLCVATQIGRVDATGRSRVAAWQSSAQAWAMTQGQLAWYRQMEADGELVSIRDRTSLERHLQSGEAARASRAPIGYILSLEGADSILTLGHLERAHADGLRALGLAHYGPGIHAQGTDATGGLTARGRDLLPELQRLGMILDLTHLSDESFWEAVEAYPGPVWASHQNCRALVPHQRQWTDDQFREVIRRGGVIGVVLDGWMLSPQWVRGQTTPQSAQLHLDALVDHIDHICQIAGNARHVGIGSDLDGAFGTEQTPLDVDSIADLRRLEPLLRARGYSAEEVEGIAHGNFLRFLREVWR